MSNAVFAGDTSGSITVQVPAVAGTNTLTLPAKTGNIAVDGPAFRATSTSGQTLAASTWTKCQFNVETFDTNSNYDNVTNYRFTPTVAGYYQAVCAAQYQGSTATSNFMGVSLWKNGSLYQESVVTATQYTIPTISVLVYLNGSTDYIECYMQQSVGSQPCVGTVFSAVLVRGA